MQFSQPQSRQNLPILNLYQNFNSPVFFGAPTPQPLTYETMIIKATDFKMMQLRNIYFQSNMINSTNMNITFCPLKQDSVNLKQAEGFMKLDNPSTDSEMSLTKSPIPQVLPICSNFQGPNFDRHLKMELEKIITFLLVNMGKNRQADIENFRKVYLHNLCLLQIYDKLVMKYFSAKKCREDIVRYIIRKVFKVLRASIIKKEKVCNKKASIILCKKYFQKSFEQIQEYGVDTTKDDDLLEFFMPYKKKSKNRTMNNTFVLEIFSSEEFCKEYKCFLAEFDNFLLSDNNNKKEKLINFLMECVQKNTISKIGSFSRLPWLDVWIEDTKNIAWCLISNNTSICDYKKIKN